MLDFDSQKKGKTRPFKSYHACWVLLWAHRIRAFGFSFHHPHICDTVDMMVVGSGLSLDQSSGCSRAFQCGFGDFFLPKKVQEVYCTVVV